jgi:uncharacterized metal-binding protein
MNTATEDFSIQVDGVKGVCPAGEKWAEQNIVNKKIPVLSCEGPCVRGDIARLAANIVSKEDPFARACYAETALVPYSAMTRWVKEADKVVMIDGCFLKCIGRILKNLVDEEKIVHIDALSLYKKYTDVFYMEDVPEAERKDTASHVAVKILSALRETVTLDVNDPATKSGELNADTTEAKELNGGCRGGSN